jgi:hypothetical protein
MPTRRTCCRSLATREVVHFLAGVDLNDVMSSNRLEAAKDLRDGFRPANEYKLGAKIIFVGFAGHSSADEGGGDYEKVVGAEQTRLAKILTRAGRCHPHQRAGRTRRRSRPRMAAATRVQLEVSAFARAALFTNQIPAFEAAPSVYRQRAISDAFPDATANARKYVLLVTNTQDVIIFDLEDKIREDLLNLNVPNRPIQSP